MNIPPKYEDVVAECVSLREALDHMTALRDTWYEQYQELKSSRQQRLTVAEQREANLLGTLVGVYQSCLLAGTNETLALAQCIESATEKYALKPAEVGGGS